jgi:1-acyl-sn-glycerol-3-phosphate acyltransferase
MAKLGGSLFVERRSKTKLLEEIERIAGVLRNGYSITLFPEGTSSNGERVLPFKGALFSTAEKANVNVLPVCIQYKMINGKPFSPENRDAVCYYGDIMFFPHLCNLFFLKKINVTVTFLPEISVSGKERKDLVDSCYGSIVDTFSGH